VIRPASVSRQKRLNDLLIKMITRDLQPFSIVEDVGFRDFVHALDPSYAIPNRQYLSKDLLLAKYNQARVSLKHALSSADAITLTTDSWTSPTTENYIAVTAHYITLDFQLGSCLLECVRYTDRHTHENLAIELRRVIQEWEIQGKVFVIVTDNAKNITAAVNLMKNEVTHWPCFAHTLNLVVQKALESIENVRSKVKKIAEYFHRSTLAADKLRELQVQMRPGQTPLKLINDVVTRWNSTQHMCQRVYELQEPLNAAIAVLLNPVEPLTQDDWKALKEITLVLKPFDAVTVEISAETTVTISKVIMLTRGLSIACLKIKPSMTHDLSKELMNKLQEGMQARFGAFESNMLLARATFLDPRFKKNGFATEEGYRNVVANVTAALTRRVTPTTAPATIQAQPTNRPSTFAVLCR
jgi:Protein of unknown function (DUF 659)